MKRNTAIVALVLILGGAVAASVLLPPTTWQREVKRRHKTSEASQATTQKAQKVGYELPFKFDGFAAVGEPTAKVVITAGLPGQQAHGCSTVEDTVYPVWALVQKNPGKIRAVFVDFESPTGSAKAKEHGVAAGCVGMQINGKQSVTVHFPGEDPYEVLLSKPIGDSFKHEEFVQAVAEEFQRQYGTAMKRPDLDQVRQQARKAVEARTAKTGETVGQKARPKAGPMALPPEAGAKPRKGG